MGEINSVAKLLRDQRAALHKIEDDLGAKGHAADEAKRLEAKARANLKRDAQATEDQRLADEIKRLADEDQE